MNMNSLKPREKMLIAAVILIALISVYYKSVYQPIEKKVTGYQNKIKRSQAQMDEFQIKYPSGDSQKDKIKTLNEECDRLVKEISEIEKKLPSRKDTSQLIGEFTRLANESKLISIRQKTVTKEGYNRIFIEIKLQASYLNAINYISRIETISDFIRVEEVTIDESKEVKRIEEVDGPPVRIVLSWILGDTSIEQVLKAKDIARTAEIQRDILVSKAKPAATLDEKDVKLEGITFDPKNPTAIINGEVFRVDSDIKGWKVKEITRDSVVLSDGIEDHVVRLN